MFPGVRLSELTMDEKCTARARQEAHGNANLNQAQCCATKSRREQVVQSGKLERVQRICHAIHLGLRRVVKAPTGNNSTVRAQG